MKQNETIINNDIINLLIKASNLSDMHNKHAAALMINKEILTNNINYIGFNRRINEYKSIHAEIDLLSLIPLNKIKIKNMDLIVIRSKNNELRNSRPCNNCIDKMNKIGIRKVFYSNFDGNIVYEYAKDMQKLHICSLDRHNLKKLICV
jgi:deoxycytidylate deaminase